jgi:hypothetical protein
MAAFSAMGIATGALAMPLLPSVGDDEAALRRLFGALKETGVSFIMPGGLTLRPGRQKELYLETLAAFKPELTVAYERLYEENRPSGAPVKTASDALGRRCAEVLREMKMSWTLPHAVYARLLPSHDAFRILLRDMSELYAERGVSVRPLAAAADRYDGWLKTVRGEFRRRRSLPPDWLRDRFLNAAELGELDAVLDNPKLAAFAKEIVSGGKVLDYIDLKLKDASDA